MGPVKKTLLINTGIVIVVSLAASGGISRSDSAITTGLVMIVTGLLNLLLSLVLFAARENAYARGCLLSAGLFVLVGFSTCSLSFIR